MFRKLKAVILGLVTAAVLSTAAWADELTMGIFSEPSSMDPHFHNLGPNNAFMTNVFGRLIEMDAPVIHSGHFIPFDAGDPFVFDLPQSVESLTLEMLPFDRDSGQTGDPIHSQPVFGAASRISLTLNADPGWYILAVTLNLPDDDCAVYWFPVGVTA